MKADDLDLMEFAAVSSKVWQSMDFAPADPGSKIEVYKRAGDKGLVSGLLPVDLHSWAYLDQHGKWNFVSSSLVPATAEEMFKAGVLWRPIGGLPE